MNDTKPLLGSTILNKNTAFKLPKTLSGLTTLGAPTSGSLLGGPKPNNDCQQIYIFNPGNNTMS